MVQPVANWRTITGIRRTSSTDTVNLIVEAYHQITDGEVARVDFYISSNGGAYSSTSVSTRADWAPDDTDTTDPLPGNTSGPAVIPGCFGLTLSMSSYAAGYIDVYAVVVTGGTGNPRTLETIRIYNDKDGTDRRPSTKVIYVSPDGNNQNDGLTSSTPVKTIISAITKAWVGGDVGGATVYLMEGTHTWARTPGSGWDMSYAYTSGHYWLTITTAPGVNRNQVILQRSNDPSDWLNFAATGKSGAGYNARIRLKNLTFKGLNCPISISGTVIAYSAIWADGCIATDTVDYPKGTIPIGVSSRTGGSSTFVAFNSQGNSAPKEIYCTGNTIHHYRGGFSNVKLSRGNYLYDIIGVAFQIGGLNEQHCNSIVENLSQNNVKGYFPAISGIDILSTSTSGRFRIRAKPTSTSDFGDAGRYILEASSSWGVKLAGFPGNNNGNFTVVGAGYENGLSYIDITNPSGSQQTTTPSGTIEPVYLSTGDPFTTIIHSDLHQVNYGAQANNWMLTNIRVVNSIQTQGLSNNGTPNGTFAIVNLFDGKINNSSPNNSYLNGSWSYGIIRNCTFAGNFLLDAGTYGVTNGEIVDCIFENISISNYNYSSPTVLFSNVHFSNSVNPSYITNLLNLNNSQGTWKSENDVGSKGNAVVAPGSLAKGSSSSNPNWASTSNFYNYDKGALRNVSVGDWRVSSISLEHNKCITLNETNYSRSDVVTVGVPFPKGMLYSTGQELVAYGDGNGTRRVQWEALPARWSDNSIKYAKISYPVTLTSGQALETNLRLGGTYTASAYAPVISPTLNNSTITFSFNGITTTLDLNSAVLIEGGGPLDHYARYRLFGRVTAFPHIWYEFVYDVYSALQHSKFWFRYGNSYAERGYGLNQGPKASTAPFSFGTSVTFRITGCTPIIEMETTGPGVPSSPASVASVQTLSNGKQYTISTVNGRDERFGIGIVKCIKGSLVFNSGTYSSASAELTWPTLSMYRGWKGLQPIVNNSNDPPSFLTTEAQKISSIRQATLPSQFNSIEYSRPYQISIFGAKQAGTTGAYGWKGITNWASALYYMFDYGYPAGLTQLNFALYACLGFRTFNMKEADGTFISLRNYPEMGIYDGSIDYRSNVTHDNAGYGLSGPNSSVLPDSWQGNNHQHFQYDNELLFSLISCDYHLLSLAEGMVGFCSIMSNPNHFNETIISRTTPAREVARPLLTHTALYEITKGKESLSNIIDRVNLHYDVMYNSTTSSGWWSSAGSPNSGLDYVMFMAIGYEQGESSLPGGRTTMMYPWQLPFAVNAFYRAYLILKELYGASDTTVLKARKIAYDLAASNVLYQQHKVGYGSENGWQYLSCDMSQASPNDIKVGSTINYQYIAPGSTILGLTSGATGTIIRTIGEIWDGQYADFLVANCNGQFLSTESVRVTNGSTIHTLPVRIINTGYIGCKSYYVNYSAPLATRQTPLTLSQLQEYDTNSNESFADKVYPGKYYRTYWPYQQWQQTCAAIAKQGIREGYYTDGTTKTVAYLQEKVEDIIASAVQDAQTYPTPYNGSYLVDNIAWPFLSLIDNFAVNENTSRSVTISNLIPITTTGRTYNITPVTTVIINRTISVTSIPTTNGSIPATTIVATTTSNVTISVAPISRPIAFVNISNVIAVVISNQSISISSPISTTSSIGTVEVISETNYPTSIDVYLEMLIDTPDIGEALTPATYVDVL